MIKYKITPWVNDRKKWPFPVYLRIYRAGKTFYVSTGLTCETSINGRVFGDKETNGRAKTASLGRMLLDAEDILINSVNSQTNDDIKEAISVAVQGKSNSPKTLLYYFDEFLKQSLSPGTKTLYTTTKNKVEFFDRHAMLESVNYKWLCDFERLYLEGDAKRGVKPISINGLGLNLRNIRAVFNYCINNEYTSNYPFRKFRIKSEKTEKRNISVSDLRKLRDIELPAWQVPYRDMFMLMFYLMGINAADLFNLPKNAIKRGRIKYRRAKTGTLFDIAVPEEAMEIINRYPGIKHLINPLDRYKTVHDYLAHMNDALQLIGIRYNGNNVHPADKDRNGKPDKRKMLFPYLTSYYSRHTFATIAAKLDIPKDTIAACLGHESVVVTDIYIEFDRSKIDDAQRKVIDYVNEK